VPEPFELRVLGVPETFHAKLQLHPEKPERGFREYTVAPQGEERAVGFWVSRRDAEAMETGKVVRLMELFNVKVNRTADLTTATFASESYEEARKIKAQPIQWIPKGTEFQCQVVMPDAKVTEGFAENACKKLKPDAIIQFERFGFTRVEEVNQKMVAYYAHP
jgi:glutamyl-tRNA synthetase